jgi:hypothetical protein
MRIHAVKAGFGGNANVQYVELRMDLAGQAFVSGHTLQFFDASGTLKATFTFPANITNSSTGDSILIGTSEFNSVAQGGLADFTFTNANTVAVNGGDPLHPIQAPNGKVVWAAGTLNCGATAPVDSVASGSAAADYGTATVALPGPSDARALRLSNLNMTPTNNSTEYALSPVSTTSFMVAAGNLASDFSTPRNNGRMVLAMNVVVPSVGGTADVPDAFAPKGSGGGHGAWYLVAAGVVLAAASAGTLLRHRRS